MFSLPTQNVWIVTIHATIRYLSTGRETAMRPSVGVGVVADLYYDMALSNKGKSLDGIHSTSTHPLAIFCCLVLYSS